MIKSKNIKEGHNQLLGVKDKQNISSQRGIDYKLYDHGTPSKKIKAPERNVSITHNLYGSQPDVQYNIPHEKGKEAIRGASKIKGPKYHSKFDGRVGNNIIMGGVEIMVVAKYLFTDVRTTRYLIQCLEKNEDGEIALAKAVKYEQDLIKKRDISMKENYLVFDNDDIDYLKLVGINPDDNVEFENIKIRDLVDENGHFRTDNFKKLLVHIHDIESKSY